MPERVTWRDQPVAVLASGGLDSAVLLGEIAQTSPCVVPIYVRFGLVWEPAEEQGLRRFLARLRLPAVAPLKVFEMPLQAVYGDHWSISGEGVPDQHSPDEHVFLQGRNLLLLAQAAVWCHVQQIPTLAMGILAGNPFPDSTDEYFAAFEQVVHRGVGGRLQIVRPYRTLTKRDVLGRGRAFPLGETFSCLRPCAGLHCGVCQKCAERRRVFADAGLPDPTQYAGDTTRT